MPELRTVDSVLAWFTKAVSERQPIDAHTWTEGAMSMNVLLGEEHEKLFRMEQNVAVMKSTLLKAPDCSVARAKAEIEATDEYRESRAQKAKIDRVVEMIRLAKILAKAANEERKGY